ncbi:MAG: hypothetical protein GC134_05700 [Proteobacteria bacterium]|nr:hypothetical protein [Pseudomonadota bacterium]
MSLDGISPSNPLANLLNGQKNADEKGMSGSVFADLLAEQGKETPAGTPERKTQEETPYTGSSSAITAFLEYTHETPEERMVNAWLAAHGISKEEFEAMSPDEQQALLDQMRAELKDKMEAKAAGEDDKDKIAL